METKYFDCACQSNEHTLRFAIDYDDMSLIYTEIYMNQYLPFYKRLWVALKYVFKSDTCVGSHWDCWILKDSDVFRLHEMCDDFIEMRKKEIDGY